MNAVGPTDAEREWFANLLARGFETGMLSLEEFHARLDVVYASDALIELQDLVRWLPPPEPPRPPRPDRRKWLAGAVMALAVAVLGALLAGTAGSTPPVPVITRVGLTNPSPYELNVVFVKWPRGTRDGFIESSSGGMGSGTGTQVTDYRLYQFPVSYRAVACRARCRPGDPNGDLVYGAWYRPDVGAALSAPPPVVATQWNEQLEAVELTITAGAHAAAPAFAIYRDGKVLKTITQHEALVRPGVLHALDNPQPALGVTYSVAACYSDCFPTTVENGFAQMTLPGNTASVPPSA